MLKPLIGIINSGFGNILPIQNILKISGIPSKLIESEADLANCDKLIIPGVGAFDPFIRKLRNTGLDQVILSHVNAKKPLLGICIGAHILGKASEEGTLDGLNILDLSVERFKKNQLHIPHMGWNKIKIVKDNPIFTNIIDDHRFYFVHSYHFVVKTHDLELALTDYGYDFPSVVGKNNVLAVQFHPEKSQKHGMQLIMNFAIYVD